MASGFLLKGELGCRNRQSQSQFVIEFLRKWFQYSFPFKGVIKILRSWSTENIEKASCNCVSWQFRVLKLYTHWHSQVGDLNSVKMLSSDKIKFTHTKEPSTFYVLNKGKPKTTYRSQSYVMCQQLTFSIYSQYLGLAIFNSLIMCPY